MLIDAKCNVDNEEWDDFLLEHLMDLAAIEKEVISPQDLLRELDLLKEHIKSGRVEIETEG